MTSDPHYSVLNREIIVTDSETGVVCWAGAPLGWPADSVLPIPGTARAVVLLSYETAPPGPCNNLVCIEPSGRIAWRAELPTRESTDAYVSCDFVEEGTVSARSWSCYHVNIDANTGKIVRKDFTK